MKAGQFIVLCVALVSCLTHTVAAQSSSTESAGAESTSHGMVLIQDGTYVPLYSVPGSDTDDAKDILQDVWYQLSRLTDVDEIESMSGWLYRVARNRITDNYRKNYPKYLMMGLL